MSSVKALLSGICGILISYATYYISKKLDRIIPWKTQLTNRFLAGILIHFSVALGIIIAFYILYQKLNENTFDEAYQNGLTKLSIILFILMLLYTIIYFALYSYYTYASLQIEAVKYERKQIDLQLKALKSQLSSHFLFNNLNTISSLAFKDSGASERYIRGLANVYKYTLNSYHSKLVPLNEELSVVNSYLLLLKTRYGNSINYAINLDDDILDSKIPPLTLQMLIENSVKHNVMDSSNALNIDVYSDGGFIVIKNNITKPPKHVNSFNIGLSNIKSRYQLLRQEGVSVISASDFIVKIPVIE